MLAAPAPLVLSTSIGLCCAAFAGDCEGDFSSRMLLVESDASVRRLLSEVVPELDDRERFEYTPPCTRMCPYRAGSFANVLPHPGSGHVGRRPPFTGVAGLRSADEGDAPLDAGDISGTASLGVSGEVAPAAAPPLEAAAVEAAAAVEGLGALGDCALGDTVSVSSVSNTSPSDSEPDSVETTSSRQAGGAIESSKIPDSISASTASRSDTFFVRVGVAAWIFWRQVVASWLLASSITSGPTLQGQHTHTTAPWVRQFHFMSKRKIRGGGMSVLQQKWLVMIRGGAEDQRVSSR